MYRGCKRMAVFLLAGCLCSGLVFTGCGNGDRTDGSATSVQANAADSDSDGHTEEKEETKKSDAGESAEDKLDEEGISEKSKSEKSTNNTSKNKKGKNKKTSVKNKVVWEKSRIKKGKTVYSDNIRSIKVLGFQEYKQLRTKSYTDKPAKGKKYLVLFLEVENEDKDALYFHVDHLSAKIDKKPVESTFLVNDPEGYQTIFRNIGANDFQQGFLVWEVPKDWKKLELTFTEFELLGGKRLKLIGTRKNLKKPDEPIIRTLTD